MALRPLWLSSLFQRRKTFIDIAVGLELWLYINRGCYTFIVFITTLIVAPFLSNFDIAPAIRYKLLCILFGLLTVLALFYLGDFAVFIIELLNWDQFSDIIAAFSEIIYIFTIVIQLEHFTVLKENSI